MRNLWTNAFRFYCCAILSAFPMATSCGVIDTESELELLPLPSNVKLHYFYVPPEADLGPGPRGGNLYLETDSIYNCCCREIVLVKKYHPNSFLSLEVRGIAVPCNFYSFAEASTFVELGHQRFNGTMIITYGNLTDTYMLSPYPEGMTVSPQYGSFTHW